LVKGKAEGEGEQEREKIRLEQIEDVRHKLNKDCEREREGEGEGETVTGSNTGMKAMEAISNDQMSWWAARVPLGGSRIQDREKHERAKRRSSF
jgi:hypothetical protein